jgi:hypothetical protein
MNTNSLLTAHLNAIAGQRRMGDVYRLRRCWNVWAEETGTSLDRAIKLVGLSRYKLHRSLEGSREISDDEFLTFSRVLGVGLSKISPFVDMKLRLKAGAVSELDIVRFVNSQYLLELNADEIQVVRRATFEYAERGLFTSLFLGQITTSYQGVFMWTNYELSVLSRELGRRQKDFELENKAFDSGLCTRCGGDGGSDGRCPKCFGNGFRGK